MKNRVRCFSAEEILVNPNKYAIEFSEGNKELETLLLFCYQNGIMTKACCKGHADVEGESPYIYFDLNENQIDMASMIIEELLQSILGNDIDFRLYLRKDMVGEKHYLLSCNSKIFKYADMFFKTIKDIIKKYNHTNTSGRFKQIFTDLDSICIPKIGSSGCLFEINKKDITYIILRKQYNEEWKDFVPTELPITGIEEIIDYLKSLNSISDFTNDDLNHSYQFNHDNITELTNAINELKESELHK